jgi:hypothetical protein
MDDLVTCSECLAEIPRKARKCRHCGSITDKQEVEKTPFYLPIQQPEVIKRSVALFAFGVIVLIVGILMNL